MVRQEKIVLVENISVRFGRRVAICLSLPIYLTNNRDKTMNIKF